ncbi:MAG: hypothetical protein A3G33_05230 [Omnitrophica bacterium RIFCSPLOWO2_12_FULL_44_17]|uniref:Glycosyltransferase 2-like domain-containing protein n=1 Tax=Candidatus Danuiimicrobium aquiferis TaxID=1801832 RepID=A0A1G1KQ37_9BACT|nr:MAG: hypothetical protein A3B72_04935 [Omnitrophica bacterium RIFCSPHIGHO2_02_FULL_45_28]OGW91254.1 MAG: hypothetical protein A3E74_04585 [Omnitrophica bacterium RIFCSPHIGHO2_12_FULL_44_12]OGW95037.1 MAG: hypothetical protein A3G33_05230 [Omnitrophica bacterium RIFCSPLOWO2_12_FULL_44_17]OGX02958.1 MAG: hypothetical protein A3J12_01450 [Omnitrophica bacterium RIFCSPLOWO2_02_FULL_44_11]
MKSFESSKRKRISLICPVLNEEATIPIFYDRLQSVLSPLKNQYDFELIFVNNRSSDKTLELLINLRRKDGSIQILTMSRNFGYQASLQAGMAYASGDALIVIDVDCEDPPELIPSFIEKWNEGYDVVYGIRKRRSEMWLIKQCRNLFYHLLRLTSDMDIVLYMAEFALISSVVKNAIINNQNTFPFLRTEIGYSGFERFGIPYKRAARIYGKTHYNLIRMIAFGAAGLLTSSTVLMRWAAYLFPLFVFFNILVFAFYIAAGKIVSFHLLMIVDVLYAIFLLTIQGVYLARVYKNGIGRPIYIIDPKKTHLDRPS